MWFPGAERNNHDYKGRQSNKKTVISRAEQLIKSYFQLQFWLPAIMKIETKL